MNQYYSDIPPVMTVEEMANILQVGRNTAYSLARSTEIDVFYVGRQIRISREALIRFIGGEAA